MQPDLDEAMLGGAGVTNVYVTAGNGRQGYSESEDRYDGLKAAYGALVGSTDWLCGWIELAGHPVEHCRLADAPVSLIFVGYPDGGLAGDADRSLLRLWRGAITSATTISRQPSRYGRGDLIALLAHIIDATTPTTLRTLEVAATHGRDHADHMMAGALAVVATAASSQHPELISYRGYSIEEEPANATPALLARSMQRLAYYEACNLGCAPCGKPCPLDEIPRSHVVYQQRRYAIGMRRAARGQLRLDDRCLDAAAQLGDCATAPPWQLDARGALRSADRCLAVQADGAVTSSACGGAGQRFFLDDDGHLWSGDAPPAAGVTALAHLSCLGADGDRPRARPCGGDDAPVWELASALAAMPRVAPLPDPASLWLADLDGDQRVDRCAVRAAGPACSLASDALVTTEVTPWGYAFAGQVEGSDSDGPAADTTTSVLVDIDGDSRADLCTARDGVIACARSLSRGFGPRFVLAHLPAGMTATALAIDTRGAATRLCATDAMTLACTDALGAP